MESFEKDNQSLHSLGIRQVDRVGAGTDSVTENIPRHWLRSAPEPDDLDDLMHVDAMTFITKHGEHLMSIIDDSTSELPPDSLPVDIGLITQWTDLPLDKRRPLSDLLMAYDRVVDYTMVLAKKMGYEVSIGCMGVDPFTLDDDGLDEFYYDILNHSFYVMASRWIAQAFYGLGLITANSVDKLVKRAEAQ